MPFTPEEIRTKDFIITLRGYDKEEVRAFLSAIATDYEAALAAAQDAEKAGGAGYETLGAELGHVLQAAKESADQIRNKAEKDAEAARRRATEEAKTLKEATTKAAARLKQEAEAQSNELRGAAEAHARKVRGEAEGYAADLRREAKEESQERIRVAAQRVQRLQAAETKIRERLFAIEELVQDARQELASTEASESDGSDADVPVLRAAPEAKSADS